MPPEMILKHDYTRMIDIYAIGALLFEMLAGVPPFYSKKRKKLFNNIVNKEVKFYKEFSPVARDFIKKLLAKDHTQRLGYNGFGEIKSHKFFKHMNWTKLFRKEIEPPYRPSMREVNFSNEFTSIPVTFNFEEEITRTDRILSDRITVTPDHGAVPQTTKGDMRLNTFGDLAEQT